MDMNKDWPSKTLLAYRIATGQSLDTYVYEISKHNIDLVNRAIKNKKALPLPKNYGKDGVLY
jgi:hypothetical protein